MVLGEANEFVEILRGAIPYWAIFFLPILIILSPFEPVLGAHEFAVYRVQQYDLQGSTYGSRSALMNVEARTLYSVAYSRRGVFARIKDLTIAKYREIISQAAGGLIILLPDRLHLLSDEIKQHILELEKTILEEDTVVPIYFAIETPEILEIYENVENSMNTDGMESAAEAEFSKLLHGYEIVVPERVTDTGNFASNTLSQRCRRSIPSESQKIHYKFNLNNEEVFVELHPNHKILSPGMVVERWHSKSKNLNFSNGISRTIRRLPDEHCHYRGFVTNRTSQVTLSTCNGLLGYINFNNENYFIEPLKDHKIQDDGKHPHLIYKRSALPSTIQPHQLKNKLDNGDTCGSDRYAEGVTDRKKWEKQEKGEQNARNLRRKRSISTERNVETLVVADKMMVDYYSDEDIETYILTVFNMVTELYRDATIGNAINIALVRMILIEDEEQENELKVTHHADNSLKSFCKWQKEINPKDDDHPNHHDVAILITRYNICTRMNEPCSTLGLAEVAGMCQPHRSCNINEDSGLALAYTVAHEIGHNFGMNHDGPHNGCEPPFGERQHVMSPHLNSDTAPFAWSNCSRSEITKFLDRDWGVCLDDEPSDHDFVFPEVPPGVMYDTDHQCRLQNGLQASYCHEIEQDVCTSLWCRQENKCVTRLEPAAHGTRCGPNKWCFNGHCTLMGERPEAINGEWGEWSDWSLCSRSCGAGVSHSERHCNNPLPRNGGHYCIGERRKYKLCNTEPCPDGTPSFRAIQCSSFDGTPYKGENHSWVPVSIRATPCQLHCKPDGEFFTVMLADTVEDGTPCNPGTRDMCINGKCRRVACDLGIDSEAQEDRCGVCHGDGTQCQTIRGEFTQKDGVGYVDVVVIPAGSRGIRIEEKEEANNYIAIKYGNGTYRLNGNWLIQWSGDYDFPGTIIYYRREGELETIHAPGQIKEDMHVMFLFQSSNPGVKYEYTIPNANVTRKPEFHWEYADWSICAATCGGGIQTSTAKCMEREAGLVEDKYCNGTDKLPDITRPCNKHQCPSKWWYGPWQHCSVTCGNNGQRKRAVICIRSFGKDEQIALHDSDCEGQDKPAEVELCHHKQPCPGDIFWMTGNWSDTCNSDPCNFQTRDVHCSVEGGPCDSSGKPANRRQCGDIVCGTWVVGNWSECSRSCGEGVQFRRVMCEGGLKCLDAVEPLSIQACQRNCEKIGEDVKESNNAITVATSTSVPLMSEQENTTGSAVHVAFSDLDIYSGDSKEGPNVNVIGLAVEPKNGEARPNVSNQIYSIVNANLNQDQASVLKSSEENIINNETDLSKEKHTRIHKKLKSKKKSVHKRQHGVVVDKVDPAHVKGVEIRLDSKNKYIIPNGEVLSSEQGDDYVDDWQKDEDKENIDVKVDPSRPIQHPSHALGINSNGEDNSSVDIQPEFEWIARTWSECSRPCSGGHRFRDVSCYEMTTETLVDSGLCNVITKPVPQEACNKEPCLEWELTDWSECTHTCGEGHKVRDVGCPKKNMCNPDTMPKSVMSCTLRPCVEWVAGPWSQCAATCGGGSQMRHVKCINPTTQEPAHRCEISAKPVHRRSCSTEDCPTQNSAKFSSCIDKLESSLCASLRHMCSTWYFKVKCCHTCTKLRGKTEPWDSTQKQQKRHNDALKRGM